MLSYDVVVLGAGAAGLHCAAIAGQRGLRVLVIDHARKVAEKIRISGGGRCNFTNRDATPANFISANPHFARSALARYTPADFIALVDRHGIRWHEKHKGQLFCDGSSGEIIEMLLAECGAGGVDRWQPCSVQAVRDRGERFEIATDREPVTTSRLVVATGGLSIPQIGASDLGYRLARQYGHRIVETRPALVPFTFAPPDRQRWVELAGLSIPVEIAAAADRRAPTFHEDLLFTHRGLSGPALQISNYWQPGTSISIDCTPGLDLAIVLRQAKHGSRRLLSTVLADIVPKRFAELWQQLPAGPGDRPLADIPDRELKAFAGQLQHWQLTPDGTEGYRKAEVTRGGVDTRELDSRDLQSVRRRGLHFIGEVVDVTGWLGGYNFQWAWASAAACGSSLGPVGA